MWRLRKWIRRVDQKNFWRVGGDKKGDIISRMLENIVFAIASHNFTYTSVFAITSRGSIVGLIWLTRVRSDINQRANILRGLDNVQPAQWRSFYRRRKTIRIYIRAREKGITYVRVSVACVREKGDLSFSLALFVGFASSVRLASRLSKWHMV